MAGSDNELLELLTWVVVELDRNNPRPNMPEVREKLDKCLPLALEATLNGHLTKENLIRVCRAMGQV